LSISVNDIEIPAARGKPITDNNTIDNVVRKLKSKYSEDVAVEMPL